MKGTQKNKSTKTSDGFGIYKFYRVPQIDVDRGWKS
jgi:hypothetical protein